MTPSVTTDDEAVGRIERVARAYTIHAPETHITDFIWNGIEAAIRRALEAVRADERRKVLRKLEEGIESRAAAEWHLWRLQMTIEAEQDAETPAG